ncbi:MAG: FxsA family protein [Pseudomonadales bacterium]|nr:FxsA family protein [Pseudomonadales bacterium]
MYRYLFLLFFLVPLLEVWILVQVGSVVGAPMLIVSIILTAAIGVYFLRAQGLATLMRAQRMMAEGQIPGVELVKGALLMVAGALLLTPGFATDVLGFVFLMPLSRRFIAARLVMRSALWAAMPAASHQSAQQSDAGPTIVERSEYGARTIEGEYTRDD